MNKMRLTLLTCLLALLVLGANSAYAQSTRSAIKNATWQTSVDDSRQGTVTLGLRDKWGTVGRYTASFVVTAPSKRKTRVPKFQGWTTVSGDDFGYISFPDDFDGKPLAGGTYTVIFYADGIIVGRDKFKFRP